MMRVLSAPAVLAVFSKLQSEGLNFDTETMHRDCDALGWEYGVSWC